MIPHLPRCQGFAVAYYGFTLGRLGSGAPSTFAQLGYNSSFTVAGLSQRSEDPVDRDCSYNIICGFTIFGLKAPKYCKERVF